ncbi:MAG: serine hydrolase domain-containing protein [Cyclobacteriaceae bacterium]
MKRLLPAILMIIISGCASKNEKIADRVDLLFSSEFKGNEPGGAVLIMNDNQIIFEKGYGLADINSKEKITPTTLFNVGSISKTFVSNTILLLASENKVNVNDNLSKYFPNFKNHSIANKVKLHHLLTHTSGLPDNRRDFLDSIALLTAKDLENWNPIEKNDSLLFEPGSKYEYSNPAFNGLVLIIEKVTGRKWQGVVVEKIFSPAGMPTSRITDGSYPETDVSHGYLKIGNKFIEKDYGEEPTFAAAGNGGVWSSVRELANYEMSLRDGKIVAPDVLSHSRSIVRYKPWNDSVPPFIGYSWFISQSEDGVKIISHTGSQGGFYADFVSIPDKKFFYVVLCNRQFPRKIFRERILELIDVKEIPVQTPK